MAGGREEVSEMVQIMQWLGCGWTSPVEDGYY
jgi:hypothetical protein